MKTGELIRKYRKKKQLTMKQLGEKIDVSEQAISQYERGLRNVNLETLIKIAEALEIPLFLLTKKELDIPGIGKINPNYDLIEEEYFPQDLVKYYEKIIDHERKIHAEYIASLILTLKRDVKVLQQRIYENEEYLKILISDTNYTLDNFLKKIEDEENKAQEYLNITINNPKKLDDVEKKLIDKFGVGKGMHNRKKPDLKQADK
ncbi:helix-turn-helix domain-containing protein [Romboutsia ilealis]|uniref:helix-turn-helix domain-containing protein n=1 Tax=Romboutsia ilealis TaxID=1115758 RepID=UPI00259C8F59|nr:helix-turn-helix transcriptional regulator [Romboutsia ilealis]